jgi:hypothetical protein
MTIANVTPVTLAEVLAELDDARAHARALRERLARAEAALVEDRDWIARLQHQRDQARANASELALPAARFAVIESVLLSGGRCDLHPTSGLVRLVLHDDPNPHALTWLSNLPDAVDDAFLRIQKARLGKFSNPKIGEAFK